MKIKYDSSQTNIDYITSDGDYKASIEYYYVFSPRFANNMRLIKKYTFNKINKKAPYILPDIEVLSSCKITLNAPSKFKFRGFVKENFYEGCNDKTFLILK